MSKVVNLPSEERIFDQASEWIAKIDRELSEAEAQAFREWLQTSERHQEVLTQMAKLWDKMDALDRLSELFPVEDMVANQRKGAQSKWYLAAAASLVVMVSAFFLTSQQQPIWGDNFVVYETAVGESSTITLADNSKVLLNTNSTLKVTYTDDYRLLKLEKGELHVDVAHDKNRPLSVVANDKIFQAVGTAFNVQVKKSNVELIVTDGKVVIADLELEQEKVFEALAIDTIAAPAVEKGEMVSLKIMEQVVAAEVKPIAQPELTANLSWRQGNIIFTGESLQEAMAEVSRYTQVKFQIADKTIEDIKIAGRFKIGDVNGLVAALTTNFNIKANRVGNNLVILTRQG